MSLYWAEIWGVNFLIAQIININRKTLFLYNWVCRLVQTVYTSTLLPALLSRTSSFDGQQSFSCILAMFDWWKFRATVDWWRGATVITCIVYRPALSVCTPALYNTCINLPLWKDTYIKISCGQQRFRSDYVHVIIQEFFTRGLLINPL